jgi:FG-GAP repeat protein
MDRAQTNTIIRIAACAATLLMALGPAGAAGPPAPVIDALVDPVPGAGGMFGGAVAGIGDVDGDGTGDLVVGAPGKDTVFIYSGASRSLLRAIADPDGLTGNHFGIALIGVGDVNGDGAEDVAVGAPGDAMIAPLPCIDPNSPCVADPAQGRAFIFSGATGALLRRLLPPGNEFLAFGQAVASLGDVNGDGVADIAVGSPTLLNNKFGQVFAFSGANGALLWKSAEATGETIASFGYTLAAIGDVNADGRRDLLVGAPFHDADPDPAVDLLAGRGYVLSGTSGAILRTHDNPTPANMESFGAGLAGLDDETGDGVGEYAISDPSAGKVTIYRGDNGASIRTIAGPGNAAADFFGYPLARVDDVDGDGVDDFWAGAPQGGKIYLLSQTGTVIAKVDDPSPEPPAPSGGFGWALAATSDLGADGLRDLIAGEPSEPAGAKLKAGAAWVIVNDRPPVAMCRSVVRSADAACLAAVTPEEIDNGSFDPDGDPLTFTLSPAGPFTLGTTPVTLTVADDKGAADDCSATVTVVDTTPPAIEDLALSRSVLWPPNHKLVDVAVDYHVTDNCSMGSKIGCAITVTSSEAIDGRGDGHTSPDWVVVDAHHLRLRSERMGGGAGRVYTIDVTCTDAAGNPSSSEVTAFVPHSRR